MRSLAYVAVGKLAKRAPHLVSKDLALLQTFFDALSKVYNINYKDQRIYLKFTKPNFLLYAFIVRRNLRIN